MKHLRANHCSQLGTKTGKDFVFMNNQCFTCLFHRFEDSSLSNGINERMSTTSTFHPRSFSNCSAACKQKLCRITISNNTQIGSFAAEYELYQKGTSKSSGTTVAASTELYNALGSKNKVNPLERILVRSNPAASSA